jgi:MFS family permease
LSGYLLFFAIGQIVYGPISDHLGRKPVLLTALALYIAVGLGCAFATSIEMLIALRCLQALGVAGAPVLARAIMAFAPAASSPTWARSRRSRQCSRPRSAACCRRRSAGERASWRWPRSAWAQWCW